MSLIKKPSFWIGTLAVGIAGFVLSAPESTGGKVTVKPFAKKSSKKKAGTQFLKEDFESTFQPVNISLKNAFQPVVMRTSGGFGSGEGLANAIPPEFTGGDSGWVYTGNAEIDGVPTALVENKTTGEGVFLKAGERWKSAMVSRILPDSVVMRGPSGTKTFALVNETYTGGSLRPMNVSVPGNLRGQIGRGQDQNFGPMTNVVPNGQGGFAVPPGVIPEPAGAFDTQQ